MLYKLLPDIGKLFFTERTVSNSYPCLRYLPRNLVGAAFYRIYSVMDIVDLPAAPKLLCNRLSYNAVVMLDDKRLNGVSVNRRFFNNAHIADTAHSHIQRPRNRRCGKGQNVHSRESFLEALLMRNSEALLLVNNCKPEIAEFYVVLNKPVSADNKFNVSSADPFYYILLLFF